MSAPVVQLLCVLAVLYQFAAALLCQALRDFSRSRLEEIAEARGRPARFTDVLRRYEDALVVGEFLQALGWAALIAALGTEFALWTPQLATGLAVAAYVGRMAAALALALLLGWLLPWAIARVAGERVLFRTWPFVSVLQVAARPVVLVVRRFDALVHRLTGREEPENGESGSLTEEIRSVVEEGEREGVLETEATTMIQRVMELQQEDAGAIMTPRTDMFSIQADVDLGEAQRMLVESGHSRVPVIGESTDDVVGILYAKDLLEQISRTNGKQVTLREIVREPHYVPETTSIVTLLETLKRERVHLAIVVDEYGGVAGLVTMEDVLEEIVGEIVDEYDAAEEEPVLKVGPGVTEVDARFHIDDLNEQFEYDLPEDGDFDTIGGFVFTQLGRIPEPGETFTWQNLRITVLAADKRKIDSVRIEVDETLVATSDEA